MNLIHVRRNYALCALGTLLFSAVYEVFSHGVMSNRMIFAFLIPLLGGAAVFGLLRIAPWQLRPGKISASLYHSALATLTVGCLFAGMMEIYGTTSHFSAWYGAAGAILLLSAVTAYLIERVGNRRVYGM